MKKLIALLTFFFAFAINANAQDRKISPEEAAKIDAYKMAQTIGLEGTQQDDFIRLFVMKHRIMSDPSMSEERKKETTKIMEAKLQASLSPEQMQKLTANPELYARLTGASEVKNTEKKK
ncbi:MAG TPA: hypothetical protein VGB50_03775 [Flavobacterium sp.]|jgi:hypothetical protein